MIRRPVKRKEKLFPVPLFWPPDDLWVFFYLCQLYSWHKYKERKSTRQVRKGGKEFSMYICFQDPVFQSICYISPSPVHPEMPPTYKLTCPDESVIYINAALMLPLSISDSNWPNSGVLYMLSQVLLLSQDIVLL